MQMISLKSLKASLLLILILAINSPTQGENTRAILERVEAKVDTLVDFSTRFVQRISYSLNGKVKSFQGRLYLKRPGKFRIETKDYAFVSDACTLWVFSARNQQVTIYQAYSAPPSLNPYSTLLDFRKEYELDTLMIRSGSDKKMIYLQLHPKEEGYIKLLEIWCDGEDLLPRRLRYVDNVDNLVDFNFEEVVLDKGISDSLFMYRPPKGVEVVDMRRGCGE